MGIGAATDSLLPEYVSAQPPGGPYSKGSPGKLGWVIRFALCSALFCLFYFPNSATGADGKEDFRKGKGDLDAGRYEEAVRKLTEASIELPLLGDYSILYLSTAYHQLGDHRKSLDTVRTLLKKYPQSPLIRKARVAELREAREVPGEKLLPIFDSYLRDYPDDEEMNVTYAFFLKQSGDLGRAKEVFKKVYLKAGTLSSTAYSELSPSDLNSSDMLERAANLIKRAEYREAERELRKVLPACDPANRREILRSIGFSLFRQKEYRQAAEIYDRIDDVFLKARSLYRVGDKEGFESALKELMEKNDKRAGGLLIAFAGDKRRNGDLDGALKIYDDVVSRYPSDAEEATWGMGWTHYIATEYKKAAGVFSKLYLKYGDPKYLYWQARSTELSGDDAKALYGALEKHGNSFYAALAAGLGKTKIGNYQAVEIPSEGGIGTQRQFERADMLLSLNMISEAKAELQWIARKIETPSDLIQTVSRFQKIGDYKRSVTLATKMPYSETLHRFWYPLAFWDDVEKAAKKHGIDPMIALSVMREESRFDPDARSVAGARGLMQLMPQTAYRLDKNIRLGISRDSQINDVRNNIHLGVYYLKSLFKEFKYLPHVLAAYNAGEAIVKRWQQQGNHKAADEFIEDIPYAETRNYVKKVMTSYFQYKRSSESKPVSAGLLSGVL